MSDQLAAMRQLVDQLNLANKHYYVLDNPIMTDDRWDELYRQLRDIEEQTGVTLPDSPTKRVGGEPLPVFLAHRHLSRLWSMDKVQEKAALLNWFSRCKAWHMKAGDMPPLSYTVEYKFDGLSLNLTYEGGQLQQAATRGNGEVGEAVLPQARTIRDIPLSIPYQGLLEIQGECIMKLSTLADYNRTATEPLKNARNAAAGALRNLDPKVTASRKLSSFFYDIGTIDNAPFDTGAGMMAFIKDQGFVVSPLLYEGSYEDAILDLIDQLAAERANLDFMIDGVVVKVNDLKTREAMGFTDKFPRWAVAIKFEAQMATTVLEKVTWQIGRTGRVTPLAHVSAVDFDGVTVRRATLNNYQDIQRKGLHLGGEVYIRRSNDVIPEIMGPVPGSLGDDITEPDKCPACQTPLVTVGANLFCPNRRGCQPQVVATLAHFASREAMDIEGLSEKTAAALFRHLDVREPSDLYTLTRDQLLTLPEFKDKRADNLLNALEASKTRRLDQFLMAIGIPNIGRVTARDIARAFKSLDKVRAASVEALMQVDAVGDIVAGGIVDFFANEQNAQMIDALLAAGVHPQPLSDESAGVALSGMTVVVTGTLPTLSRSDAEDLIRQHGGVAASAVSRKTSFVVAGEKAGSKLDKAQALGIPVLSEQELLERLT